jgi:hypothetical protein
MLKNTDGLLHSGGEWDSPPKSSQMLEIGDGLVRNNDGLLFLGAGAEPLSHRQLQTGHYDADRPSGIS